MKKLLNTLVITLLVSANLFAQMKPIIDFQNAVIIKKTNDSINCQIELNQVSEKELAPLGEGFVTYKTANNSKKQSMKIIDIQSIKTAYSTYLNVQVDRQELLFKIAIHGKVSLLEYPKISIEHTGTATGGIYKFGPKEIQYYALKVNDKTYVIKLKKDLNPLMEIIENCPGAKAIINDKAFKINNLVSLVTQLNECK
jgi:hypothetical protein